VAQSGSLTRLAPAGATCENEPVTEPYDISPARPSGPKLPGRVVVRETAESLVDAIAADLLFQAQACVRAFGDFHLALSGGSTPQPLYRRLMYDPRYRDLPWKRTHLWIVDERRVPFEDDQSNFRMIRELIVDHSDVPPEQVHAIFPLADDAAERYERELIETLSWREKGHDRLDFLLLGLGDDGHTASLFPNSPALASNGRLVLVNDGPHVTPPDRVTMTLRLINGGRLVGVMVTGEKKREAVGRLAAGGESVASLPSMGLRPVGGELRWYLDGAACPVEGA